MSVRERGPAMLPLAVGLFAVLVTGCDGSGMPDDRGPVSLAGREASVVAQDTLEFTLPSCLGQPELTGLTQDNEAVTVEVVATVVDPGRACADVLRVELDEALGERHVMDATSGEALRIVVRH